VSTGTGHCGDSIADCYEVRAQDRQGVRLLAPGTDIAPGSLALANDTLYWTQGGQPVSAVPRWRGVNVAVVR
jgi:hypothetical protein